MSMEGEKRGTHLRGKCSTVDKEISGYQWGWEKRPNGNRRKERRPMVRVSKPRQSFTSRFITPSSSSPHHAHVLISIRVVSLQYPAYHRNWWFVQLTGSYWELSSSAQSLRSPSFSISESHCTSFSTARILKPVFHRSKRTIGII